MSDQDSFGDNPFRALKLQQFPDKAKPASRFEPAKAAGKGKRLARAVDPDTALDAHDREDREFFWEAISRVAPMPTKKDPAGFLLEEQCSLPATGKGKKARRSGAERAGAGLSAGREGEKGDRGLASELFQRDEESAAFLQAMGQVSPLQGRGRDVVPAPGQGVPPPHGEVSLQDVLDGKLEFALSFTDEYLEGHVVGLDQMIMNKLRAGSLSPEAHLDLHGLNAVQAFEALRSFMRASWYKGLRTVLVVPGRGRNSPAGVGILREKLQSWLTQEPCKRVVLGFCTAQPHDGGLGSVYVLLRKYRKKGRIYWERLPADEDLL